MSDKVKVFELPDCDICGKKARYDARTRDGRWAYLCGTHWEKLTTKKLGTGLGQRLVLEGEN